jgi:KDO2-lipid IV(A) lauroyltransferase
MHLALGSDVPADADRLYFEHVAWSMSHALGVFHNGLKNTSLPEVVTFGETIQILDLAVAEGRGVLLTSAHWTGHELAGGCIAQRYPVVMLVREAPTPERTARKLKWYAALGAETVLRPSGTSPVKDAVIFLKILKQGKVLAMTPDLLTTAEYGIDVSVFGRTARLHGGAFALALAAGAPIVRTSGHWLSEGRVQIRVERASDIEPGNRDAMIHAALQDWCRWFERTVRANPENWLFWLDKHWTRYLHASPRAPEIS